MPKVTDLALRTSLVAICASTTSTAWAQETPLENDASSTGIEEIIVTAERRAESAQRTPIAITAVGGESLRESSITNVEGLSEQIPNVNFQRNAGDAKIFIRGIGYNSISPGGETRAALYVDNFYQSRTQAGLLGFYDVDRIEVLRGPQGTLYGRNSIAGAINILTRDPGQEVNGYLTGTVGSYSLVGLEGAVGGTLSDGVEARIAFRTADRGGFGKNLNTGENVNDERSRALRAKLTLKPSGAVTVRFSADYARMNDHSGGYRYGGPGNFAIVPLGFTLGGQVPADKQDSAGFGPRSDIETYGLTAQADFHLADSTTLTLLSGYRRLTASQESNVDGFTLELSRQYIDERSMVWTHEARLAQDFGDSANLIVGAYYFRESNSAINEVPHKGIVIAGPFGQPGLDPDQLYDFFATFGEIETDAYAAFAQVGINVTEKLKIDLGGRYSYEEKSVFEGRQLDVLTPFVRGGPFRTAFNPAAGLFGSGEGRQQASWNSFDPKVTVSYQATPSVLMYGTYSQGFKSGGFNIGGRQAPFKPEELTNYELGVKADIFDRRLRVNASAFRYDYRELQQNIVIGNSLVTRNAGKARLTGLELELTARPVDGLDMSLNASYLDGKFIDFVSTDPQRPGSLPRDLRGNQLPNAPKYQLGAEIGYTVQTEVGDVTPRVNVTWNDRVFFTEFNTLELFQPSRTMVNLYLGWKSKGQSWSASMFVRNLTDDTYISNAATSNGLLGFPNTAQYGSPRTVGMSVTKEF